MKKLKLPGSIPSGIFKHMNPGNRVWQSGQTGPKHGIVIKPEDIRHVTIVVHVGAVASYFWNIAGHYLNSIPLQLITGFPIFKLCRNYEFLPKINLLIIYRILN